MALLVGLHNQVSASPPVVPRSRLPEIERHLRSDDADLQSEALSELMFFAISNQEIPLLPRIIELCHSNDRRVARGSLSIVGKFAWWPEARREHGSKMVDTLAKALQSSSDGVRRAAAHAIVPELVDEHRELALPMLILAAEDADATVRLWSVITMGKIRHADGRVVATLRQKLADPEVSVRRRAALALAEHALISEAAIPELVVALQDPSGEVSGSAAHALGEMGDPAMEALIKMTDAPDARVRMLAVYHLGGAHRRRNEENSQRIVSLVQRKLDDPDPAVRATAALNVSLFGELEARVAAIPTLLQTASQDESLDAYNAYLGIHRCIREFASALADKNKAEVAFRESSETTSRDPLQC